MSKRKLKKPEILKYLIIPPFFEEMRIFLVPISREFWFSSSGIEVEGSWISLFVGFVEAWGWGFNFDSNFLLGFIFGSKLIGVLPAHEFRSVFLVPFLFYYRRMLFGIRNVSSCTPLTTFFLVLGYGYQGVYYWWISYWFLFLRSYLHIFFLSLILLVWEVERSSYAFASLT